MPDPQAPTNDKKQAPFIVTGTVVKIKAATMPEIDHEETLILKIDTVIKAPAMFESLAGQQITVRFASFPDVKEGDSLTIYATGWIFGQTIAVDAIDYAVTSDKKEVIAQATAQMTTEEDTSLKERLASAQTAVVGKVTNIEKKIVNLPKLMLNPDAVQTTHISEHDPDWHEATIQVDEWLKGATQGRDLKVTFPKSDDVRWYGIHKFQEGQQGIWLLQNGKVQNTRGLPAKVLAAIPDDANILTTLHANDFLPLSELGKIKSLINQ